jgi:lipopolysaccharide biosynthesis regulator YciM
MFENLLSWLLLPLGVVLGLSLARNRDVAGGGAAGVARGMKLDSVQPEDDRGINALSRAADADPGVVELQMTLGSLFRKRGEVERAIHLQETVLAKPSLSVQQAATARTELAQDYLRAGLMDRAESLLQSLVSSGTELDASLELLLDLYEQGRDWSQAIATARRLESVRGIALSSRISQYFCELAEAALHAGELETAQREAERALDTDRGCVRASLFLGSLFEKRGDSSAATRAYSRAIEQDNRYLPEALAPLKRCFDAAADADGYKAFLDDAEADYPDSIAILLAKTQLQRLAGEDPQAYLAERLSKKPDWRALLFWLEGIESAVPDAARIREALHKRLQMRPRYVCSSCGLSPSVLFWQCPSCKQWATISPASDAI